jgi:type II secretory pathway predicted ATPase ExeA
MTGMSANETAQYIRHHLSLAGRGDTLFSDDAITLIHANSRGKPRAVNNLALAALLAARINDQPIVDEANARTAITETTDRATT